MRSTPSEELKAMEMNENFRNNSLGVIKRFFWKMWSNIKLSQLLKEMKRNEAEDFSVFWSNTDDSDDVDGTCISDARF